MTHRVPRLLLLLLFFAGGLSSLGYCARSLAIRWKDPERRAALDEYWQGHRLFDAGKYLDAIPHYDVYRQLLKLRGEDDSEVVGSIASCSWRGGRTEEALALFAESIATNPRWYVCVEKAHCLVHRDRAAALQWLDEAPLPAEGRTRALAEFHRERREFAESIPHLDELLCLAESSGIGFDDHDRVIGADLPLTTKRHNQLAEFLDPLEYLAECHYGRGDLVRAGHYARRGVAVGQRINESKAYYEPPEEAAGSVDCRLWLARIAMERGAWELAAVEIEHARVLADRGSYSVHQDAVRAEIRQLELRRTKR